ncbi:hypothetical protein KQJ29_35715 [Enterococcus sp. S181_ASV_20]|nr:hypothetical protein [Enterococcus sp. S181_ASV_20]
MICGNTYSSSFSVSGSSNCSPASDSPPPITISSTSVSYTHLTLPTKLAV